MDYFELSAHVKLRPEGRFEQNTHIPGAQTKLFKNYWDVHLIGLEPLPVNASKNSGTDCAVKQPVCAARWL